MKRALLLTICLIFSASMVFAQAGNLDLTMDAAGTNCNLNNAFGFMQVHVVHRNSPGATASQFSVQQYGVALNWVGTVSSYNLIGTSPTTGYAAAYGTCLISPIDVMTLSYVGTSAPCDYLQVEADPGAGVPGIYVTDCVSPVPNLLTIPKGGLGFVNDDGNCPCDVPSEDTSWGQIKALYQ